MTTTNWTKMKVVYKRRGTEMNTKHKRLVRKGFIKFHLYDLARPDDVLPELDVINKWCVEQFGEIPLKQNNPSYRKNFYRYRNNKKLRKKFTGYDEDACIWIRWKNGHNNKFFYFADTEAAMLFKLTWC